VTDVAELEQRLALAHALIARLLARVDVLEATSRPSALAVKLELVELVAADRELERRALTFIAESVLRLEYSKDVHAIAELRAIAQHEWTELARLIAERDS
jgi:hypothetical protein